MLIYGFMPIFSNAWEAVAIALPTTNWSKHNMFNYGHQELFFFFSFRRAEISVFIFLGTAILYFLLFIYSFFCFLSIFPRAQKNDRNGEEQLSIIVTVRWHHSTVYVWEAVAIALPTFGGPVAILCCFCYNHLELFF